METRQRPVVKATLGELVIGLTFAGSLMTGGAMAAVNAGAGLVTYILYELIWARFAWARRS